MKQEDLDYQLFYAIYNNDQNTAINLLNQHHFNYNYYVNHAIVFGNNTIINKLIQQGANDFDQILKQAAYYNNINIIKSFFHKIENLRYPTSYALFQNNLDIAKFLILNDNNKNNLNYYLSVCVKLNYPELAELLLKLGADQFDLNIQFAKNYNNKYIENLIRKFKPSFLKQLKNLFNSITGYN